MFTFIDSDQYQSLADTKYVPNLFYQVKPFDIVYSKIEHARFFCFENKSTPCILLTDCDFALDKINSLARSNNILYWFGTNVMVQDPKIEGIPIGLPQITAARGIGNKSLIQSYRLNKPDKKGLAYMSHVITTNVSERYAIYNIFRQKPWVTQEGGYERVSYEHYIESVVSHYYMFSPPGAGIDCHRTWEALYLGTVPIVKNSYAMSFFKDLPILFVDQYDQVTEQLLMDKLPHFIKMFKDPLPMLNFEYWKKRIFSKREELKRGI